MRSVSPAIAGEFLAIPRAYPPAIAGGIELMAHGEAHKMTIEQNQDSELSDSPEPPRFDAEACATAQQVEPLQGGRVSGWLRSMTRHARAVPGSTRLMILVVIAGLAVGAIVSTLVWRIQRPAGTAAVFSEARAGVSALNDAEAADELKASFISPTPPILENATEPSLRVRRQYDHARGSSRRRAYRVAVIK